MKNKIDNTASQLRPVVLLLAIAVILPTVCLLWFMTQTIKNEQLAIRQKLIDSYTARGNEIFNDHTNNFSVDVNNFSSSITYKHQDILESADANTYEIKIEQIRNLLTQKKTDEAIELCRKLVYDSNNIDPDHIVHAGLFLVEIYEKIRHKELLKELNAQFTSISEKDIPTSLKVFALDKLIGISQRTNLNENLEEHIKAAKKFIAAAKLSLTVADFINQNGSYLSKPAGTLFKTETIPPLYVIFLDANDKNKMGVATDEKITRYWQKAVDDFTDKLVFCRIYDNTNQQIAGEPKTFIGKEITFGSLFKTIELNGYFTGWKAELYLRSGVFKEAADKKKFIYLWVAIVVIALMLASTLLAGNAVLKQARLNKLKNDFIATITHELKTPLASMRVLVDTLLEQRCESKQQEIEYLELIAKENLRLSRLIDSFLTFSRMERNKQAFEFATVSPAEIAKASADAVQIKFNKENCNFNVTIQPDMPSITADKDAMVTAVVNLLDNAFKYSGDSKKISLKIFTENNLACFSVKDTGIGMTRRQMRKSFDRFYQVDSSLARRAEGTGLGLSIVKFIVDAHKAKIEVESKPGKGSEFTIKLATNE